MAVIYIKEQGAYVQKSGERIIVTKNGNRLMDIAVMHIDNLSVIGNVQITAQALHMLMERGIDVSYFSYSGKFLGHTAAESSKNIFLRFEQYNCYLNMEKRMEMAKIIVNNKILNQIELLKSHRWHVEDNDWKKNIESMEKHRMTLESRTMPNELLGTEGICSNIYFSSFGKMLKCDFSFDGRNRRPPKDPVNVILSLAYTFLTKEISNALDAESFESYIGFLHGIRYGRKSLALDIVEEFRQPIVDRLVLLLFNKRMLGRYDFEIEEDRAVILGEEGFKKFCTEYEKWMNGKSALSGETSYRQIIRRQIACLKKSITKHEVYTPYRWRAGNVSGKL